MILQVQGQHIDTTGDITITSTKQMLVHLLDQLLIVVRDSASSADADYLGQIKFKGESDDGGAQRTYSKDNW